MRTVVQQCTIPGPPEQSWRFITEPTLLAEWFADCSALAPGASVQFEFGDGDFFTAEVRGWSPPRRLELTWKFLGIGAAYDIRVTLAAAGDGTEVLVEDRGARTDEEAAALANGWVDFLSRLEQRVRTGQRTRYRWSESFVAEAIVRAPDVRAELASPAWWRTAFPGAEVDVTADPQAISARFIDPAWHGTTSEATVEVRDGDLETIVRVTHDGFEHLPETEQLPQRRRYAQCWSAALGAMERQSLAAVAT